MNRSSLWGKFKNELNNSGMRETMKKSVRELRPRRFFGDYLDVMGVLDGLHAYKGPEFAQIDLTNNCNNDCIGCWCNSPLLEDKKINPEVKRQALPFNRVLKLLDELSGMGTRHIYYAGGGEPFMHSEIMEILRYTKRKGFICYVNTNFTLLDERKIKELVRSGVDHLTVSIWAATPEVYCATHPNKDKAAFYRIKEMLQLLNSIKRSHPVIKLYNVIFNMNYHEFAEMIEFAINTNSESIEFTVIDTIPDRTDNLLLDSEERKILLEQCNRLEDRRKNGDFQGRLNILSLPQFMRRLQNTASMTAEYDSNIIGSMPCYAGWTFIRILADGNVNSCLKSHRFPVGNILKRSFSQIWNNRLQQCFREKALRLDKNDSFFRLIGNDPDSAMGCFKSCDNLGHSLNMHGKVAALGELEKKWLERTTKIMKLGRKYFNGKMGD